MFLDEKYLKENPEKVEEIEKSTLMIPSGLPGGTTPHEMRSSEFV
jgi:hypothetical protein